jgi:Rieske 2Fe-2S family protein
MPGQTARIMTFKPRTPLPATAFTLPAEYYTSADVFRKEQDRFFHRMWMCVGRLEDLPSTGSYLTCDVAGASLVVLRATDDGQVRAFHNVCRHRGTRLCAEATGRLAGGIRCPYHAWTYDFDGALIGAPHMDGSPGFRREDFPLGRVRAATWEGFVFVSLAGEGPTLVEHLADVATRFAAWDMRTLVRAHRVTYDLTANWKLVVQNYNECLHCPTLHPALNGLSHYLSGENEPLHPTWMGGRMDLSDGVQTMSMDGRSPLAPLPSLPDDERRRVYYYSVFPNFLVAPHPDFVLVHTLWPSAPDRTRVVCDWLVRPEARDLGVDLDGITGFWDLTNRQDWRVCELAQAGIASAGYRPGPYSSREDLLYAFDRFVVATLED